MRRRGCFGWTLWSLAVFGPWGVESARADETPLADHRDETECRSLLAGIQDNVFSFDDDAFYCYCRLVTSASGPGDRGPAEAEDAVPWRFMLERPADYRGKWVTVEGTLRRRSTFQVPDRLGDMDVHQCELSGPDTRAFCTVITTDDPGDVPLGSAVVTQGYFIKIRSYKTGSGETGAGPLIVARGLWPIDTSRSESQVDTNGAGPGRWIFAGTAILAFVWLVLRRAVQRRRIQPPGRRSGSAESDADFDWLTRSGDGGG